MVVNKIKYKAGYNKEINNNVKIRLINYLWGILIQLSAVGKVYQDR